MSLRLAHSRMRRWGSGRASKEAVVDDGDVEPELAEVFGWKCPIFNSTTNVAELVGVEEEQVDVEVFAVDVEVDLAADD